MKLVGNCYENRGVVDKEAKDSEGNIRWDAGIQIIKCSWNIGWVDTNWYQNVCC